MPPKFETLLRPCTYQLKWLRHAVGMPAAMVPAMPAAPYFYMESLFAILGLAGKARAIVSMEVIFMNDY